MASILATSSIGNHFVFCFFAHYSRRKGEKKKKAEKIKMADGRLSFVINC